MGVDMNWNNTDSILTLGCAIYIRPPIRCVRTSDKAKAERMPAHSFHLSRIFRTSLPSHSSLFWLCRDKICSRKPGSHDTRDRPSNRDEVARPSRIAHISRPFCSSGSSLVLGSARLYYYAGGRGPDAVLELGLRGESEMAVLRMWMGSRGLLQLVGRLVIMLDEDVVDHLDVERVQLWMENRGVMQPVHPLGATSDQTVEYLGKVKRAAVLGNYKDSAHQTWRLLPTEQKRQYRVTDEECQ